MLFIKRCVRKILLILFDMFFSRSRVDDKLILFKSEGDFCDNARALYEYMLFNNYNKVYHLVWIVENLEQFEKYKKENVDFIEFPTFSPKCLFLYCKYLNKAKFFFTTHMGLKKKKNSQISVNLWHGAIPLKASNSPFLDEYFDFQNCPSLPAAERMAKFTGVRKEQVIINSDCRLDYFFTNNSEKINTVFKINNFEKKVIVMPTFKSAKNWIDGIDNEYVIPCINNEKDLRELSDYCEKNKILLIVKIHHLQDIKKIKIINTNNVLYINDDYLFDKDIQLYELLANTDALLTDFSSVSYDYLLRNKPIGYFISNTNDYSRGFIIPNIEEDMVGFRISSLEDLKKFLLYVNNKDDFAKQRKQLLDKFFVYQNGGNCKRLLEILNITI